ncbi:MAG: hypothetical protein NVV68_05725 [Dokdonella sp.]|nr:hypothetical protein [Dokdonella sp.]
MGWLQAMGRRSYEIYLTHMFVVFAVVAIHQAVGADTYWGFLWHLPTVLAAWALGALLARFWSDPINRRWRAGLDRRNGSAQTAGSAPSLDGIIAGPAASRS